MLSEGTSWHFDDGPMIAYIECWPGSFVIFFQGIRTNIATGPNDCDFLR